MGLQQSKDALLNMLASDGDVEGIKALRSHGAGLEWIDTEGKTALIAACMNAELYNVAKTLIETGANVKAYRPGRHAGTPLHHAAERGLEQTVKLLLSHGANALAINDECQTPLDIARAKGYGNVVRTIEEHFEWTDMEGKTKLTAACMHAELYNRAKTLIELGANVNAYHPGRRAGTPLHHAAERGLGQTVKLLLSHGANALVINDDCETPLDIARAKGYGNVVRTIEAHLCLFSGCLQELYGPGFLERLAPKLLSRKVILNRARLFHYGQPT